MTGPQRTNRPERAWPWRPPRHLDIRVLHALLQRRRQPRVELDGGEACGPLEENIGGETGSRTQLENVCAGIQPVERPRNHTVFYRPPPQRGSAEEAVQQVDCSPPPVRSR